MEVSPRLRHSMAPANNPPGPPRFSGLGDVMSRMIGVVDGNRLVELTSTDIIGMCLPRTGIEASMRPPGARVDAARETAIREISGLVGNIFVVGWFSHMMLKLLGNQVNRYNPNGLPPSAWINAETLEAFGKLYEQTLQSAKNPAEARARFINTVLNGLISGDRPLSKMATLQGLGLLEGQAQIDYLTQLCKQILPQEKFSVLLKEVGKQKEVARQVELLTKALTGTEHGHLSDTAKQTLAQAFGFKRPGTESQLGTNRFNERAAQLAEEHLRTIKPNLPKLPTSKETSFRALLDEPTQALYDKEFIRARFRLSMDDLRSADQLFAKAAGKEALAGGLTHTVHLLAPDGTALAREKSRDTILQELKHFLEQFVDRATHNVNPAGTEWKETVLHRLFSRTEKSSPLSRLIPQADDGLVATALKSKTAYTHIPLALAIVFSIGVAFYNNWLTRKKHGGKMFFPGEGGPQGATTGNSPAPLAAPLPPASGSASVLRRDSGAFTQFQLKRGGSSA